MALTDAYAQMIEQYTSAVLKGAHLPQGERTLTKMERDQIHRKVPDEEIYRERQHAFVGELYARLQALPQDVREKIASTVSDPVLDGAFHWLGAHSAAATVDDFVLGYDAKKFVVNRHFNSYLRPIVLLDVLREHPETVNRLDENSSYFPHRLLAPPAPISNAQVVSELREVIPSLFSDELVSALDANAQHIRHAGEGLPWGSDVAGKYKMPPNVSRYFTKGTTQEQLDNIFTKEVKRDLYHTLDQYLVIAGTLMREGQRSPKNLPKPFGLVRTEFKNAIENMENYATNLLLHQFKTGQPLYNPFKSVGVRGAISDDKLVVQRFRTKQTMTKENLSFNTTMRLPYLANVLKRVYDAGIGED